MLLPEKYEAFSSSLIVVGGDIIQILSEYEEMEIIDLFKKLDDSISLISYFDVLTFFFIADLITVIDNNISLKYDPK
jgi:hypothetical protein